MRLLILAVTTSLLLTFNSSAFSQSNNWIVGSWQLSYDPDGDSKDTLVFKPGNQFINIAKNGEKFTGNYKVNNGRVKVTLNKQGKAFMVFFLGYEKSKDALHYFSEETKQTSIYKKSN